MVASSTSTINLKEFGRDGVILMAYPTYSRKVWCSDEQSNHTGTHVDEDGRVVVDKPNVGIINVINTLTYVKDAPEPICKSVSVRGRNMRIPDIDGFMQFMDELDEENPGASTVLASKMSETANEIAKGAKSPFVN